MEPIDWESVRHALVQGWNLRIAEDAGAEDALIDALAERVRFLMRHDINRLMTGLYVLDVPEGHFRACLMQPDTESASRELAEAIVVREREKAAARERFRRKSSAVPSIDSPVHKDQSHGENA